MSSRLYHEQALRLLDRALQGGASRHSVVRAEWDISGDCQAPVLRELYVRPSPKGRGKLIGVSRRTKQPVWLFLHTRCRKCDPCRAVRARLWTFRAKVEIARSERTWFGTITLAPEAQHRALSRARARLARQGVDFDGLDYGEQLAERHRAIGADLTRYIKRVRKMSGAPLRYILVMEAHKSGLPHYHMLVHESDPLRPVRYATLKGQWKDGFTKWNLIPPTSTFAATYVAKYLAKSTVARVRASKDYGKTL